MEARQRRKKGRHERNKLNEKQLAGLTQPGIYSDGGGLYVRARSGGTRSWIFIYSFNRKREEMGLGSLLDVSLAKARERAAKARDQLVDGQNPKETRRQAQAAERPVPTVTFGEFTNDLLDSIEDGFKNPKHRQQWRNTLTTYAASMLATPISDITTEHVLAALQPIWLTKAETASRVRGRIERVLDAAKAKGLRSGENPAAWRGHLDLLLPKQSKGRVQHHAALPFSEVAAWARFKLQRSI